MKIFLFMLFISFKSYAYRLNTNIGAGFNSDTVKFYVTSNSNCTQAGVNPSDLIQLAKDAANDFWNRVPTADIKLVSGGILQTSDALYLTGTLCAKDAYTT
ncbi:MAG: hypothetical protein OEW87_08120, partial [Flavobacteriaceae bacterium]|nr:hypothetical protein [Flavobacteriaceae bacterium]